MQNEELIELTAQGISALITEYERLNKEAETLNKKQEQIFSEYNKTVDQAAELFRKQTTVNSIRQKHLISRQADILDAIKNLGIRSFA